MARTDIASQHESSSPISPALKNVGTLRFLTDGVQNQTFNQFEQVVLVRRITQTNAQPLGLRLTRSSVENLEFAGQSVYPFCVPQNILAPSH